MPPPRPDTFREGALRANERMLGGSDPRSVAPAAPVSRSGVPAMPERRAGRRVSVGATFLGWSVAAFFTLVLSAASAVVLGGRAFDASDLDVEGLASAGFVAYLLATLVAYVIGGYAAGRIAPGEGLFHALAIVGWSILFATIVMLASGRIPGELGNQIAVALDARAFALTTFIGAALVLAVMLSGAALGGMWGERAHANVHEGRRLLRGRPQ